MQKSPKADYFRLLSFIVPLALFTTRASVVCGLSVCPRGMAMSLAMSTCESACISICLSVCHSVRPTRDEEGQRRRVRRRRQLCARAARLRRCPCSSSLLSGLMHSLSPERHLFFSMQILMGIGISPFTACKLEHIFGSG